MIYLFSTFSSAVVTDFLSRSKTITINLIGAFHSIYFFHNTRNKVCKSLIIWPAYRKGLFAPKDAPDTNPVSCICRKIAMWVAREVWASPRLQISCFKKWLHLPWLSLTSLTPLSSFGKTFSFDSFPGELSRLIRHQINAYLFMQGRRIKRKKQT